MHAWPTRSHARRGAARGRAVRCIIVGEALRRAGRDDVAGPFCAGSRAVHDQRACRLELLSRTGSSGRRPRLGRDWAPAPAQCPITRAMVAICGDRVRRAGCLNLALRLASDVRSRALLILHTREIGWPAGRMKGEPWRACSRHAPLALRLRHERFVDGSTTGLDARRSSVPDAPFAAELSGPSGDSRATTHVEGKPTRSSRGARRVPAAG